MIHTITQWCCIVCVRGISIITRTQSCNEQCLCWENLHRYLLCSAVSFNSAHVLWSKFKSFTGKELIWKRCHLPWLGPLLVYCLRGSVCVGFCSLSMISQTAEGRSQEVNFDWGRVDKQAPSNLKTLTHIAFSRSHKKEIWSVIMHCTIFF